MEDRENRANREKRIGMGPVPASPQDYLNEIQVNGLIILQKFGWKLVCIRRPADDSVQTLIRNRIDRAVGILGRDGVLRLSRDIRLRAESAPDGA